MYRMIIILHIPTLTNTENYNYSTLLCCSSGFAVEIMVNITQSQLFPNALTTWFPVFVVTFAATRKPMKGVITGTLHLLDLFRDQVRLRFHKGIVHLFRHIFHDFRLI